MAPYTCVEKCGLLLAISVAFVVAGYGTDAAFAQHAPACPYEPAAEQVLQGIPLEDVACGNDLALILVNDNYPMCVKDETIKILRDFGWEVEKIRNGTQHNDTWYPQPNPAPVSFQGTTAPPGQSTYLGAQPHRYQSTVQESLRLASSPGLESLGLAVGGAADIENFRQNVANGYLPLHTDITYEGLFYDYLFDTGSDAPCDALFCPSYSYAASRDPFSNDTQRYISVGLNSGLEASDFQRKNLNLVIVLDVSGSMDTPFDRYHYDNPGGSDDTRSKMQVANEAVAGLLDHLGPDDNLGVALFNNAAHLAKPLESVACIDRERLKHNIMEIYAGGGTNMDAGMALGTSLFVETDGYENRIIFLTDAMPNLGDITREGLLKTISDNSQNRIHATFIGIGVDFNTELVETLTKVRGANYYSVHSASEFKERMVDEFEFMVTPLVFDLELNLEADGYDILEVYGSPEADQSTGNIMKVSTLFPSERESGESRGGIILIKLEQTSGNGTVSLSTKYESVDGEPGESHVTLELDSEQEDFYENTGIRKGVLLSRYATLMKAWILDERAALAGIQEAPPYFDDGGIRLPDYAGWALGFWERQSVPLHVSDRYAGFMAKFAEYFAAEMTNIGDQTLRQELDILEKLAGR